MFALLVVHGKEYIGSLCLVFLKNSCDVMIAKSSGLAGRLDPTITNNSSQLMDIFL